MSFSSSAEGMITHDDCETHISVCEDVQKGAGDHQLLRTAGSERASSSDHRVEARRASRSQGLSDDQAGHSGGEYLCFNRSYQC